MTQLQSSVREAIHENAGLDATFALANFAATVIASAGLIGDSSATIIGAMLVATLMGPIMGIGLALVDFDNRLLRGALLTLAAGTALVLGVSVLIGVLAPQTAVTSEMLSRTSPRLRDLIAALASGAICAFAAATPRLSAAIIGVSIAVALVPPLATAGLLVARAEWGLASGAVLLAFVNIVAIQFGTSTTLWLLGYRGGALIDGAGVDAELRRQAVSILLMVALTVTLGLSGLKLIRQQSFETAVRNKVESTLVSRPEAKLIDMTFATPGGRTIATAVVRSPAPFTQPEVAALAQRLPRSPDGLAVRLRVRHVQIDVVGDGE